ncbi:SHUGOSHIN 2-like [Salvia splendens]|uniref:SHUGOSHIN 2-like n=1 Tax=Salvia splendens TaxID=180675 RepID=UPI001C25D601|nr:SHUGOSHIN 2-like [Salvia splendens]
MPKPEGFHILNAQNAAVTKDKAKDTQNVGRRKLADISNQPQNQRLLVQEKSQSTETNIKEYIHKLHKDNMALVKMIAQRNEIIEQNGVESDRLRVNLLKMQEQNQHLATYNAQILVEINSGKDKLKMLQHVLGCKAGLLKVDLEGREKTTPLGDAVVDVEGITIESSKGDTDDQKPHETKMDSQKTGVFSSESGPVKYKDKAENKRKIRRRQSARFNAAEVEHGEDFLETKEARVSVSQMAKDSVREQRSTSETALVENESRKDGSGPRFQPQQLLLRPSRAAKEKVQSYKEVSLCVKLRRPE